MAQITALIDTMPGMAEAVLLRGHSDLAERAAAGWIGAGA